MPNGKGIIIDIGTGKELQSGQRPARARLSISTRAEPQTFTPPSAWSQAEAPLGQEGFAIPETWGEVPFRVTSPAGETIETRRRPDNTIWVGNQQIGTYDPEKNVVIPEAPSVWGQLGATALTGLSYALKPFELFHEYVGVPFAMGVTAPWWQETWWEEKSPEEQRELLAKGYRPGTLPAEDAWQFLKQFFGKESEFREAYHGAEMPKYVRGALETVPWFFIPPAAKVAQLLGRAGKPGMIAAKALTPIVKAEELVGKAMMVPLKLGGKVIKRIRILKDVKPIEFKPLGELEAELKALHPERLRPYGVFGRPIITTAQKEKFRLGRESEEVFKRLEVIRREDQLVKESAVPSYVAPITNIGDEASLFGLKEVAIPGTKLTHEVVTASWIKPRVKGASMALDDILGNPSAYQWVGWRGQHAKIWAQQLYRAYDAMGNFRSKFVERSLDSGVKPTERYVHSVVVGQRNPKTGVTVREIDPFPVGTRGGKSGALKPQVFKTQMDGIKAGYKYERPTRAFALYTEEMYNMATWERSMKLIEDLFETPLQRMNAEIMAQSKSFGKEIKDLVYIQQAVNRVKRGEILPKATIAAIARRNPDAARAVRVLSEQRQLRLNALERQVSELQVRLAEEVEEFGGLVKPVGELGSRDTIAMGADPAKKYAFKFEVVEANAPVASHTAAYAPNPNFPSELQPRLRERILNREQVERMARELDADSVLVDTHRLDSGAMIIARDNVIESGNGRLMAIRRAIQDYPERYANYREQLQTTAKLYGLEPKKISAMDNPILVRRRITEVPDRTKFVREANETISALMSPLELAFADVGFVPEEALMRLNIEGKEALADALRDVANSDFIRAFVANVPSVERAQFLTSAGGVSEQGIRRISNAILAKAFPGKFGIRLAEANIEAIAPQSKILLTGLAGSAGDLAKLSSAITKGRLADDYHIALDLAEAAERFLRANATNLPIEAAMQPSLFEGAATPIQQALIRALDKRARSATSIRNFIREYTDQVLAQPGPGQAVMPGFEALSRETILGKVLGETIAESPVLKPVVAKVKPVEMLPEEAVAVKPKVKRPVPEVEIPEVAPEMELSADRALKDIRGRLASVRAEAKTFAPQFREARQRAITAAFSEGRIINLPGWSNRIIPDKTEWGMTGRDIADRIVKILTPEKVNVALRVASRMARMGVTLEAAMDLSLIFIQGGLVMGHDVAMWAQGRRSTALYNMTKEMLRAIWNPKYQDELIAREASFIRKMAPEGLIVQKEVEYLRPTDIENLMRKGRSVGGFFGDIFKQSYGRAGAGFGSGSLAARLTIAKQMERAWVTDGQNLRELAEFSNKITGVVSSAELGVSATRRALESAALFAPNYTRAYLMVVRDLFRGNKTGAEVRKAMAGMLAGGVVAYVGLCEMIGQEPKLNPAPVSLGGDGAEFMAVKIGNSTIGIPGFWYSAFRTVAAVTAAAEQDPERLMSLNWRENDFLKFWMGRTSPMVHVGRELVEGRDYLGRRLEDPNDWAIQIGEKFMTIAAQNIITRDPSEEEGKWHRVGAEIFGLKAFPQSQWNKLKDMKDKLAQKDFSKPFDELNLEQKDQLLEQHPDYHQLSEEAREKFIYESGEDFEIWLRNTQKQAEAEYHGIGEMAAQNLLSGQIDYRTYLDEERFLRRVYQGARWAMNFIADQADPERAEDFREWLEETQKPEDKALERYWEIYRNPGMTAGVVDWDVTEKRLDEFLASLDEGTRAYVLRNRDRWLMNLPPAMRKLAEIQAQGRDIADEYYDQAEGKARLDYRRANPTVDAWLLIMGRVTRPQTQMALSTALELLRGRGLPNILLAETAEATGGIAQTARPFTITSAKSMRVLKVKG